jgi:RNA polymerase sigma-70 factor (ECF subfamily)
MREIFELSRKDNLSHKEIAAKLNISEQTVKKQVQNALKAIKPKLNDMGVSIIMLLLMR